MTHEEPKNPLTEPVFLMKKTIISINEKIKDRAIIIDVYINKDYSSDIDSFDIE